MACNLRSFQQYFNHIKTVGWFNETLCAMEPRLLSKRFALPGIELRTARSAGLGLTHRPTGASASYDKEL